MRGEHRCAARGATPDARVCSARSRHRGRDDRVRNEEEDVRMRRTMVVAGAFVGARAANAGDSGDRLRRYGAQHHPLRPVRAVCPCRRAPTPRRRCTTGSRRSSTTSPRRDLTTYFKSERFGVDTAAPSTIETVPRSGVTIERDSYNVPHVTGATHDDGVWAAGWIAAEDRGLLLEQARYNARVAAIDAPGLDALSLISGLRTFVPSAQTEAEVAKQIDVLAAAGPEGEAVLHDIDVFISRDQRLPRRAAARRIAPWTRNDVFALNALKGQFVGQGGGDEARRSQFLAGLQQRLGTQAGAERLQRPAPVQEPRAGDLGRRPLPLRDDPEEAQGQRRSSTTAASPRPRRSPSASRTPRPREPRPTPRTR